MFDKLVESTKTKTARRSGRIFMLTGVLYAMLLSTLAVWTILGLNPGLAEGFDLSKLTLPVPYTAPPVQQIQPALQRTMQSTSFVPPSGRDEVRRGVDVPALPSHSGPLKLVSGPGWPDGAQTAGPLSFGATDSGTPIPPPPASKPKPTPEPTPETQPTPKQVLKVSDGVTQGMAIHRASPVYPPIARAAQASGAVQVQILISEEGRVLTAEVLNGHPLLRQASLDAARQWVFRPTLLSKVPVKVQGILTFNFALN